MQFSNKSEVVKLTKKESLIIRGNAHKDYILGMKAKDIAEKYHVSVNTIKSWIKRLGWNEDNVSQKGCIYKKGAEMEIANEIKEDLLKQLKENEIYGKHFEDLVNDYMALWDIKNRLISDITLRGVSVEWNNGKQTGMKKNDSIPELNKTSAQMLKILSELGLKPSPKADEWDDI